MRQNKSDLRKLRRQDANINPQEHGIRFKRFLGDDSNMENVYRPVDGQACGKNCQANKNANVLLALKSKHLLSFEPLAKEFLVFFEEILK